MSNNGMNIKALAATIIVVASIAAFLTFWIAG